MQRCDGWSGWIEGKELREESVPKVNSTKYEGSSGVQLHSVCMYIKIINGKF